MNIKKRFQRIMATLGVGTGPATNINGCVYGPPTGKRTGERTSKVIIRPSEVQSSVDSSFSAESNIPEEVYGPPSFWKNDEDNN